jgi:repressor LexA
MAEPLTGRQQQVLDAIVAYERRYGYPPTVRELQGKLRLSSPRGVAFHLENLESKGWIRRDSTPRGIRVLAEGSESSGEEVLYLPLVGHIAAGVPLLAEQNIQEWVPVPKSLLGRQREAFLLQIKGDSMVGAHILEGDLVIVRPQPTAENGEIVVALIGDEATVKRFHKHGRQVVLKPANPAYEAIELTKDVKIQGKVIGVLRNL